MQSEPLSVHSLAWCATFPQTAEAYLAYIKHMCVSKLLLFTVPVSVCVAAKEPPLSDLLSGADVQPLHHLGEGALVDHLAHQVGPHPLGVGEAPQQFPRHLERRERRSLRSARPRRLPLGRCDAMTVPSTASSSSFSPSLRLRGGRFDCGSRHYIARSPMYASAGSPACVRQRTAALSTHDKV